MLLSTFAIAATIAVAPLPADLPEPCHSVSECARIVRLDAYAMESDEVDDPIAECLIAFDWTGIPGDNAPAIYAPWRLIEWCANDLDVVKPESVSGRSLFLTVGRRP